MSILRDQAPLRNILPSRVAAPVSILRKGKNSLLENLPQDVWERLSPHLEMVELEKGTVLFEAGTTLKHVYFPISAIISLLHIMESGASAQTAMVGHEGIVGVSFFMSGEPTSNHAMVLSSGCALRLKVSVLDQEFNNGGCFAKVLLRYTQSLLNQMAQTAVCNRHHSLEQQLCRLILMCMDRLPTSQIMITHETISNLLGVRREGVTQAAGKLQRMGLISCTRGCVTVLDRDGMEDHVCECYEDIREKNVNPARSAAYC